MNMLIKTRSAKYKMANISIIIPVYNVEEYLERCLDSIIKQSYKSYEVILVNDGSKDKSGNICDNYAKEYGNIYVIHQDNQGVSSARNVGLDWAKQNSDSKWITFIDSDDWIHPQYLELLLEGVIDKELRISSCKYQIVFDKEFDMSKICEYSIVKQSSKEFFLEDDIQAALATAKLYAKELFDQIRYPANKIHEDEFVTYKLLFETKEVAVIENKLYAYYQHSESIVNSPWSIKRLDKIQALEEQLCFFENLNDVELILNVTKKYIKLLKYSIKKLRSIPDKKKILCEVCEKLRYILKKYRNELSLSYIDELRMYMYTIPNYVVGTYRLKKKISNVLETVLTKGMYGIKEKLLDKGKNE